MDNETGLINAYQLSVDIIKMSLALLEEILRLNHRGWELFFKASCFVFSNTVPRDSDELRGHKLSELTPKFQLIYDKQNLNKLFQSKMFQRYFKLLDDLFSDTTSRYNVINDLLGESSKHYVIDSWIKIQGFDMEKDMYGSIRSRILDINNISLRCFYMNMVSVSDFCVYSVILQKWAGYYHDWFSKGDIE
jgi:hypothetical protein